MGLCMGRPRDGDFTGWCERHCDAIQERVEVEHDVEYNDDDPQHVKWADEETNKLWEECADCDPRGGDGEDD